MMRVPLAFVTAALGVLGVCSAARAEPPAAPAVLQIQGQEGVTHPRPVPSHTPRPPWARRQRTGVKRMALWAQELRQNQVQLLGLTGREVASLGMHPHLLRDLGVTPRGRGLIDLRRWPAEPPSPPRLDLPRFVEALEHLCPVTVPRARVEKQAQLIARHSAEFGVDPLLLGALVYQQGRCGARQPSPWGVGLTMLNPGMHRARIREGAYRYGVLADGVWRSQRLPLPRFSFSAPSLHRPAANIYFAAAILKVFSEQCPAIDGGFASIPHRHFVSHFIWGDKVRGAGAEDCILTARRRLLEYYHRQAPLPAGRIAGLALHSPLDGAPRKISSHFGDVREGGRRFHTGVDFESQYGEPVHAVADGLVKLAGFDDGTRLRPLAPGRTRLLRPRRLGKRGLLVTVEHGNGIETDYMHLSAYVVRVGKRVRGGDLLGYVGRTGIHSSAPHLHFALRRDGVNIDPAPPLRAMAFAAEDTWAGRNQALAAHRFKRQLQRRELQGPPRRADAKRRRRKPRRRPPGGTHRIAAQPRP